MVAILERAGLSTRAFYRHFQSKDELFLALLRQEGDALSVAWTALPMSGRVIRSNSSRPGSSRCSPWLTIHGCACISR